jgi:uncharacterized protein (TIGR02266 family)
MTDRRRSPRIPVDIKVRLQQNVGEVSARAVNLSNEGMCIHTAAVFGQGDQIKLAFRLPDTFNDIDAVGRVMWTLDMKHYDAWGCGVGILFEQLQTSDSANLENYISQCLDQT